MGTATVETSARRIKVDTCVGACVGTYIPYETGHPVEGQPNLGKVLELTLNQGFDPRTKAQVGPKTGDPETFRDFEELYAALEQQLQFCEDTRFRGGVVPCSVEHGGVGRDAVTGLWREA